MHPLSWITFNMFHQNVISVVPLKSWKVNWELSSIKCHSCTLATDISWTCLICKSTALIMKCEPEKPVKRVRQHCVLPMAIMVRRCGGGTRLPDVSLGTRGDLWPLVMSWECVLTSWPPPSCPRAPGLPAPATALRVMRWADGRGGDQWDQSLGDTQPARISDTCVIQHAQTEACPGHCPHHSIPYSYSYH